MVRLVGKGFFEVEKMPDKRFVVEMGDVVIKNLCIFAFELEL